MTCCKLKPWSWHSLTKSSSLQPNRNPNLSNRKILSSEPIRRDTKYKRRNTRSLKPNPVSSFTGKKTSIRLEKRFMGKKSTRDLCAMRFKVSFLVCPRFDCLIYLCWDSLDALGFGCFGSCVESQSQIRLETFVVDYGHWRQIKQNPNLFLRACF